MAAIGVFFSKNGKRSAEKMLEALDGPGMTDEDLLDALTEEQALVLFGKTRLEAMKRGRSDN